MNSKHGLRRRTGGRSSWVAQGVFCVALLALLPGAALAQSSISGLITDETGGALPGVTVEASSPDVIEQVRVGVSDGQGRYAIIGLQPGTYTVIFTLPGFSTFQREDLGVGAGVSVPVNAVMAVGALEETVTVSGETPVVDIQQAAQQQVLDRDMLDSLPTNRTTHSVGSLISGLKMSGTMVGGIGSTVVQMYVKAPGQHAQQNTVTVDGLDVKLGGYGAGQQAYNNFGMTQEVSIETNPASAEVAGGGVRLNMIPKDGGNTVSGDVFFSGMNSSMQANNITQELKDKGLRTATGTERIADFNPGIGGPIVRDKLWYYASARINRGKLAPAGATYYEVNPATGQLEPGSEQAFNATRTDNLSFRLTYQLNRTNKITTYRDQWWRGQQRFGLNAGEDAATSAPDYDPGFQAIWPTKWTSTPTNKILTEFGYQHYAFENIIFTPPDGVLRDRGSPEWYANATHQDLILRRLTVSSGNNCCRESIQPNHFWMGAVSYVTGSHQFKVGGQLMAGFNQVNLLENNGALTQRYRNGVPDSVSVSATPTQAGADLNAEVGIYAQDRWTINRLTVNAGIRYEGYKAGLRATESAAGRFVPARSIEESGIFDFKNVLPRFSLVYDLFGTATTALKFSAGKYVESLALVQVSSQYNPINGRSETRNWTDTNGDDIAQDSEIGPSNISNFGWRAVKRPDENLERPTSWQYSVSLEQQLTQGVALTVAWFHNKETGLWANRDVAETASAFDVFQIANPNGNGELVNVYNLIAGTPTGDVVTRSSLDNNRTYHGFQVSMQARLPNGGVITGGWFTERKLSTLCDVSNPNQLRFCDEGGKLHQDQGEVPGLPFRNEFKLALSLPLPGKLNFGVAFSSYPGGTSSSNPNMTWLNETYSVPRSAFNVVGGRTRSVSLQVIPPGTKFLERLNQLDLSVKRTFTFGGGTELLPSFEVFNLTNASTVLSEVTSFGGALGQPRSTLPGRFVRLGALFRF